MNVLNLLSKEELGVENDERFNNEDLSFEIMNVYEASYDLEGATAIHDQMVHNASVTAEYGVSKGILSAIDPDGTMNAVFESIDLETVSTESIDETPDMNVGAVASEGFKETAKRVGKKIADIIKKMIDAIKKFFERWMTSRGRMEAALKKLKEKKSDIESANEKNFGKKKVKALKKATFDKVVSVKFAKVAIKTAMDSIESAKTVDEVKTASEGYTKEKLEKAYKPTLELLKADNDKGGAKKDDVASLGWKPKDVAAELSTAEKALQNGKELEKQKDELTKALTAAEKEARSLERIGNEDEYKLASAKISAKNKTLSAFSSIVTKEATIHSTIASTVINLGKAALGTKDTDDDDK